MATSEERIGRVLKITQLLQSMVDDGAVDNIDVALFATATMHRITGDISDEIICGDYETLLGFPNLSDSRGSAVSSLYATADYLKRGLMDCVHAELAYVDVLLVDNGDGYSWDNQQCVVIDALKRAVAYVAVGALGDAVSPIQTAMEELCKPKGAHGHHHYQSNVPELPPLPHFSTAPALPPLPAVGGNLDALASMVNLDVLATTLGEFRDRVRTHLDGFVQEQRRPEVMPLPLPALPQQAPAGGGNQFLDELTVTHNLPPLPVLPK